MKDRSSHSGKKRSTTPIDYFASFADNQNCWKANGKFKLIAEEIDQPILKAILVSLSENWNSLKTNATPF